MQKPTGVKATSDRPRPAFHLRRRPGNRFARNAMTLSKRSRHDLEREKERDGEKRSPTKSRINASGSLFFHFESSSLMFRRFLLTRVRAIKAVSGEDEDPGAIWVSV
jgi:hypothetical protein